jgi:hypothetical protein
MQAAALVVSTSLLVAGIIHLIPLIGIVGPGKLEALYGLDFTDPNLSILMQHRAALIGMLGAFLVYAAFRPALQALALVTGLSSVVSFLFLAMSYGDYNPLIGKVVVADIVALVVLLVGVMAYIGRRRRR